MVVNENIDEKVPISWLKFL